MFRMWHEASCILAIVAGTVTDDDAGATDEGSRLGMVTDDDPEVTDGGSRLGIVAGTMTDNDAGVTDGGSRLRLARQRASPAAEYGQKGYGHRR